MITIDGSYGEGGGQILRTSLALSLVTGQPFTIENIRAGRKKPGLMRQHLTAVNAATQIGNAEVSGNRIGSQQIFFEPKEIRPGSYRFAVGTAGSTTLVMQTVLPALMVADGPSELVIEGGTHNPYAPPFDFLQKAFLPLINRMGVKITADLEKPGFYPAGGGCFRVHIEPCEKLSGLEIIKRGEIVRRKATAYVSKIPNNVAKRELKVIAKKLNWDKEFLFIEEVKNSPGPGNILTLEIESESITEVFTGFGEYGVRAEQVAAGTIKDVREYLASEAPVGRYLADQLIVPMALSGGGKIHILPPTRHTTTNVDVLVQFLNMDVRLNDLGNHVWEMEIRRQS